MFIDNGGTDLKSVGSNAVPVRVRPRVLVEKPHTSWGFLLHCCFSLLGILWNIFLVHIGTRFFCTKI